MANEEFKGTLGRKIIQVVRTVPVTDDNGRTGMRSIWYLPDGPAIHAIERDAIPLGTYFLRPDFTGRFQNWVIECFLTSRIAVFSGPQIVSRRDVEVHIGNRLKDTEGCIIPGTDIGSGAVWNSRDALNIMRESLLRDTSDPPTWIIEIIGNA